MDIILARWGSIALLLVGSSACELPAEQVQAGASLTNSGTVRIHHVVCGDDRVHTVQLVDGTDDTIIGDADDDVLWKIEGKSPPGGYVSFDVGSTPPGFTEVVQFEVRLSGGKEYAADVDTSGPDALIGFRLRDLRREQVLAYVDEYMSVERFIERASQPCE